MAEENALLARRWFELITSGARSRVFPESELNQMIDPRLRVDFSRNVFNPGVYDGLGGLRQVFEGVWDVWETLELVPLETVLNGDQVAVRVAVRARGRDGVAAAFEEGTLFTIRDRRVLEFVGRMEWQEALEALR